MAWAVTTAAGLLGVLLLASRSPEVLSFRTSKTPFLGKQPLPGKRPHERFHRGSVSLKEHGLSEPGRDVKQEQWDWDSVSKKFESFWKLSKPYFVEESSAKWLLGGVIALAVLNSGVSVAFSYLSRDFWTALNAKSAEDFQQVLVKFSAALAAGVPITVYYAYQREQLALQWRGWMTARVLTLYVGGDGSEEGKKAPDGDLQDADSSSPSSSYFRGGYYALERASTGGDAVSLDNPDQRIAEDVASFTRASLRLLISVLRAVIDLFSFSAILYSIYPQLFLVIIAYASIGTLVTIKLGRQLVNLNYQQLRTEADFRFSLVRIRENAEAIAFYGGEDLEKSEAQSRLRSAVDNRAQVILTERNLDFFTTAYQFLIQVLPGVVVAPLYFTGRIELGVVSQSFGAFNHILNDFSIIINQFDSLSQFSAGVDRLAEFADRLQMEVQKNNSESNGRRNPLALPEAGHWIHGMQSSMESAAEELLSGQYKAPKRKPSDGIQLNIEDDTTLAIEHLTLHTPDGSRTLIRDLSIDLSDMLGKESDRGAALLVSGVSGAGKSSLLRAIAGLWGTGEGIIRRPPTGPGKTFFLPQRPYCPPGTLRDQIIYPANFDVSQHSKKDIEAVNARISNILDVVKLGDLVERFERDPAADDGEPVDGLSTVREWGQILSLGEQQRLSFARLLYNGAKLAILDEATSALDVENEAVMYQALASVPGISYVSVGHRPTLERFHDVRLRLATDAAGSTVEALSRSTIPVRK